MRMPILRLTLLTVVLTGTAAAQGHEHPPGQAQGCPMMGMMQEMGGGMMAGGPAMILRLREPLALTPQQVQRLEEIQRQVQQEHERHMAAAMESMREAGALLESDAPDLAAYETRLRGAAEHHVQAHVLMASAMVEARATLTPEQRSNLSFGLRMMRHGMPERMEMMHEGSTAPRRER